jgi:small GTP-binding protein
MDDKEQILKGILYSNLGKTGPEVKSYYPEVGFNLAQLSLIAIKSMTILTGEEGRVPERLSIIPFTKYEILGLIHHFEVKNPESRGGAIDSNLTVLFDEKYSSIAYKYSEQFEPLLQEVSKKIIERELAKQHDPTSTGHEIRPLLQEAYDNLLNNLASLREAEKKALNRTQDKKPDFRLKIVVLGDPGVGKTTMLLRYVEESFKESYLPTIGVNISSKDVIVKDAIKVRLNFYDIAGQDKFELTRRIFYDGLDGTLLVFDVTNAKTLGHIDNWVLDVISSTSKKAIGMLVGNKIDLKDNREVKKSDGALVASKYDLEYLETSAKTGENIIKTFEKLAEIIIKDKGY